MNMYHNTISYDMSTNAGIVSDALKYVERKTEQFDRLKEIEEEEDNYKRSILNSNRMID